MKNILIISSGLFLIFFLIQCSGTQKPNPKVVACQEGCDKNYNGCFKKAAKAKNEAKKAACEAVKAKCYDDCEKK